MEPTLTAQTDLVSVTPVMKAMPPPDVQKLKTVPIRRRRSSQCKNVGSSSCTKNGTTYYNGCGASKCSSGYSCKNGSCVRTCTAETCSGYTLTSCPSNGSCSSCTVKNTDCSSGATKYKLDSCAEGYRKDGNSCTFMCSGYMATKACGFGSYGDCGPGGVYSTCPYGSCYVKCNVDICRNWGYSACWANTSDRWCLSWQTLISCPLTSVCYKCVNK